MYLAKAKKEAEKEEKERNKRERELRRREAAKVVSPPPQRRPAAPPGNRPSRPSGAADAQAALEKAEREKAERRRREQAERRRREEEERQMQLAVEESKRQHKLDQQRQRERQQEQERQRAAARARGPPPGPTVIKSQPLRGGLRVASFHDEDELDQHWQDVTMPCRYVGTFAVDKGGRLNKAGVVSGMQKMGQYLDASRPAALVICREGIKVVDTTSNKVAMAHSLNRMSMALSDGHLFSFVAKNPKVADRYCHVFHCETKRHANDLQALTQKAFRFAAASNHATFKSKAGGRGGGGGGDVQAQPKQRQWAKHNPLQGVNAAARPSQPASARPSQPAAARPSQQATKPSQPPRPSQSQPASTADDTMEAVDLSNVAWYQPGIPREIAMELLMAGEEGSFIVRDSSSQPGQLALTMKANGMMHHYIIRRVPEGVVLGSEDQGQKPLPDLATLIIDYSRYPGCLPIVLNLDTFNKMSEKGDDDDDDATSFVDPDYQSFKELGL